MRPRDGFTHPLWYEGVAIPSRSAAEVPVDVDVCVVGAGIAGLTTAYLLAKAGRSVVVLDEGPIGSGQTGQTSAHLASAIDDRFVEMERVHGERGAQLAFQSHAAAIDRIAAIAAAEQIDCEFAWVPGYLVAAKASDREELEKELVAARKAGIAVELVDRLDVGGAAKGPCLRFGDQARFHPLKYLVGLSRAAEHAGARIFEGVRVAQVHGRTPGERARVDLASGTVVLAEVIVVATNPPGPIHDWAGIYFKQAPYRTYVIGMPVPKGAIEDALYWDNCEPYHYVRIEPGAPDGTHDVLVVGGEDHRSGLAPSEDPFAALERWTRETFPTDGEVTSRWSGQVLEPVDGLAFIGRAPTKGEGVYVITGDSGMGLTHGTLGAELVTDLVLGRENPWTELYDPERKPTHNLGSIAKEALESATGWLDLVTPGDTGDAAKIAPGCGALVRRGLKKLAVYRDDAGKLHECSAICPHLGAVVQWNAIERTWDCPSHGSRFAATGELIMGPSVKDLSSNHSESG